MKKFNSTFKISVIAVLLSSSTIAFSQNQKAEQSRNRIMADTKVSSVIISEERQTPSFISLNTKGETYTRLQLKPVLENYLAVRVGIDKTVLDKETKIANKEVLEFQQYFKGVKVDRAKFKVYLNNGRADFFNGEWYDVPASLSITPSLNKEQALVFAKNRVNAKEYVPDAIQQKINNTTDTKLKAALQKELLESSPGGELVIIRDFDKPGLAEVRLAYKFNIYASNPLSRSWVYVDAINGKILLIDAIIKHVNDNPTSVSSVPTPVQTRYAGLRNVQVKQISGNDPQNGKILVASNPAEIYTPGSATYVLIDDTRGNGVETYDLNGVGGLPLSVAAFYSQGKSFTDVNNDWTLAEHKRGGAVESENDDFGWDAHWGAGVVYDYWKAKHNRLSFDGNNAKIKSFIHSGLAYDNAFWNGSVMTYGDGSGTAANGFKPLTSLDVCGHEIGHGVCQTTSDLIYAKESGAMNEAFSDIWASCIERFAIQTVDASLGTVYKPFYIGEQISASPASPLRRMDNPKAATDPDTYGGQYWRTQNCSPTLANDYCGVHTNSGVLNKWFYLITVGSGAGSGPDAIYAGEDDGVNDAVTTGPVELQHPANTYQVTGLGFDVAENIAYLTELLLNSSATYAEARAVSIEVAIDLSGNPCSALVESVTNAWYAVGVGAKFVKPCTITYGFVLKNGAAVLESSPTNGCTATKTFNISVIMPPNSTASLAVSGTANNPLDYTLSATSLSNTTTTLSKKVIVATIVNDGATEGDEYVQLNLTLSNTGTNPVNSSYRLTILDDDVVPVLGVGQRTLLTETFTRADGFTDPSGWTEILEVPEASDGDALAAGKNQWGVFDNKLAITGKDGLTGAQLPNSTYNNNSPSQTIIKSPLIDARGLSVVTLNFDYIVQGEIDPTGAVDDPENLPIFDYMAVAYSIDGVTFTELNTGDFRQFASAAPAIGSFTGRLPASLGNKQFYLGFRWFDDTNAGGPVSVSVDNVTVTAGPRTIENDLGHGGRENLSPSSDVYFYSTQDAEVVGKVKNASTKDFGCTYVYVEKTGTGAFNLYQNNQGLHKVSDKIIRIETSLSSKSSTSVTLFFTEAQLQGLEAATGKNRTSFLVYHVQAIAYTSSTSTNTNRYTPTYTAIPGVGGSYTVSFTEKANGSYALGAQVSSTNILTANRNTDSPKNAVWSFGKVSPNPLQNNGSIGLDAPMQQLLKMEIVNEMKQKILSRSITVEKGASQITLPSGYLRNGRYIITLTDEKGRLLFTQPFIKY